MLPERHAARRLGSAVKNGSDALSESGAPADETFSPQQRALGGGAPAVGDATPLLLLHGYSDCGGDDNHDDDGDSSDDVGDEEGSQEEEDEEEEEDESSTSEVGPRELPERATRGCRMRNLIGQAALEDAEFWSRTQWVEEDQDEEWSTEDEKHYKDEYDSDFDRGTTDEEEAETDAAQEARLDREEVAERRREKAAGGKHVYVDPRSLAALRAGRGAPEQMRRKRETALRRAKALAAKRPKPPPPAVAARSSSVLSSKGHKPVSSSHALTQEAHLKLAKMTEVENTKMLQRQVDEEMWKKTQREEKAIGATFKGKSELLVSWSSDRLLENEKPFDGPTHRRDLLFFINFDQPTASAIPSDIYTSVLSKDAVLQRLETGPVEKPTDRGELLNRGELLKGDSSTAADGGGGGGTACSSSESSQHKYRDPVTLKPFSSVRAFLRLRRKTLLDGSTRLGSRLASLDRLLSATLDLFNSPSYDQATAARETLASMKQLRSNLLDPHLTKKTIKSLMAPSPGLDSEGGSSSDATPAATAKSAGPSLPAAVPNANTFVSLFQRPGMEVGDGSGTTPSTPLTSEDEEARLHMPPPNDRHPSIPEGITLENTPFPSLAGPPMPRKRGRPPKNADPNAPPKQRAGASRRRKDVAAAVDPMIFQQQQQQQLHQQQLLHMQIAAMANNAMYSAARQPLRVRAGGGNEIMVPMWMPPPQQQQPWGIGHPSGFAMPVPQQQQQQQHFPQSYMFPFHQQPPSQYPFNFPPNIGSAAFPMVPPPFNNVSLQQQQQQQHHHHMMLLQQQQQQPMPPALSPAYVLEHMNYQQQQLPPPPPPSTAFGNEQMQPPPPVG